MAQPLSLLAELRALEAKRAQAGLSPPEELRLAELRAVAGQPPAPAAGPGGFDVNAAAAVLRESVPPVAPPSPAAAAVPEATGAAGAPAEATVAGGEEGSLLGEVPADWSAWDPPSEAAPAGPAVAADAAAPVEEAGQAAWDPAVEAAWDAYARAHGWDPAAPWDPETAAAHWEGFSREMGWAGAAQPAEAAGSWAPGPEAAGAEAAASPAARPAPRHGAAARESDTASWDLGGPPADPAPPGPDEVPDERDPGATAQWSLAQVLGARAPAGGPLPEEPEPVVLEELHLESEGSFGAAAPAAGEPAAPLAAAPAAGPITPLLAWSPPGSAALPALELDPPPAPVEVGDDQILEVGEDVTEVEPTPDAQPGAEELPVVDAVEMAEEAVPQDAGAPPAPEGLASPAAILAEAPPPEPLLPEPFPPEPEPAVPPAALGAPALDPPVLAPPAPRPAPGPPAPPAPEGEPIPLESLTIDEEPVAEAAPRGRLLPGLHRVVLHTVEGQVMRGLLQDPDLLSGGVTLSAQPEAAPERVPSERLRAIFFMLGAGEKAPDPAGLKVRVTFRDGRQVAGYSADYDPDALGFFMIPAESRTNTARIWVYRSAVRQVAVS